MQTDIFNIADEATVTPEPDIYECDDCGELFTPEQVAAIKDCPDCIDGKLQPKFLPEL